LDCDRIRDAGAWAIGAQHAAPLQGNSSNMEKLFDDDSQEFLFPGSKEKFGGFAQIDVSAGIIDAHFINLDPALLDQAFRFAF
jgi:hypothetical protein